MSDGKYLDTALAPTIRDDVVADDQPAGACAEARRAGVRKLGQQLLGAFERLRKSLRCRHAVFGEVGRDFLDLNTRARRTEDAGSHFLPARSASALAIISLTRRNDSSNG